MLGVLYYTPSLTIISLVLLLRSFQDSLRAFLVRTVIESYVSHRGQAMASVNPSKILRAFEANSYRESSPICQSQP